MQLTIFAGLVQRNVYYACELYSGQLQQGDDYQKLHPVYSICLINGNLWPDANQVHHAFRLTDQQSGRVLQRTLEIHTLELARYTLKESDLATADILDCWLYWFLHAHEYEAEELRRLFPQPEIRQATETLERIAQITEDKAMYDAREKALRDQQWQLNSAFREGEEKGRLEGRQESQREARLEGQREGRLEGQREGRQEGEREGEIRGKIELIRTLQAILCLPVSEEQELRALSWEQLQSLTTDLQERIRNRPST
jgi:predicted transposase/invertase (TIGR01784 family)